LFFFFFSSRRRHTRCSRDWSSDVCSSDLPAEDALVAKAMADWTTWSAVWLGIESGITKFCAEAGLTDNQLLVWADGRSAAVERARGLLHDDARADRRCEDATRQKLRRAWQ